MSDPYNAKLGGTDGSTVKRPRLRFSLIDHTHAGHIYETAEEQIAVTAAFFRASLGDGHRCVYVHDHEDRREAVQALVEAGLDAPGALESSALQVEGRPLLPSKAGEFDVERAIAFIHDRTNQATAAGYAGIRGLGDMIWTLPSDPNHKSLIRYESLVTGSLRLLPGAAICQYDRARFDDEVLFDVICTHPWIVIADTVCQNPYHVPEGAFEERERGSLDLDNALGNLLARERQERWLAAAESELEAHDEDHSAVDVSRLAAIYEHMRDYKLALRERVRWRLHRWGQRTGAARYELAALGGEIEWLEKRASLWRRRELQSFGLLLDPISGTLGYRGRAVGLSRLDIALLRALLEQAGQPIDASQLIRVAWERDVRTDAQLRNYIVRLRGKLEALQVPASIVALRGRGYQLVMEGPEVPASARGAGTRTTTTE